MSTFVKNCRWVLKTPLGRPVVPDVKMMVALSSGEMEIPERESRVGWKATWLWRALSSGIMLDHLLVGESMRTVCWAGRLADLLEDAEDRRGAKIWARSLSVKMTLQSVYDRQWRSGSTGSQLSMTMTSGFRH